MPSDRAVEDNSFKRIANVDRLAKVKSPADSREFLLPSYSWSMTSLPLLLHYKLQILLGVLGFSLINYLSIYL